MNQILIKIKCGIKQIIATKLANMLLILFMRDRILNINYFVDHVCRNIILK